MRVMCRASTLGQANLMQQESPYEPSASLTPVVAGSASAAAALPLVPAFSRQASAQSGRMTIAVLPTNTAEQLSADARDIERFLADRVGMSVELIFPTSYAGVVEALRSATPRPPS